MYEMFSILHIPSVLLYSKHHTDLVTTDTPEEWPAYVSKKE